MKTLKKILSLLLVICMLATVLSFTACNKDKDKGGNDDEKNNDGSGTGTDKTYTVTVVDGDNIPVAGVKLAISDGKTYLNATTDANGKASGELPEGTIGVMIVSVPDGYEKPEKASGSMYHASFKAGSQELTLEVEKKADTKVTYTVKVIDNSGNPVEGMEMQLCPGGVCLANNFTTDANGEITVQLEPGKEVHVKLLGLDSNDLPAPDSDGYHAVIEENETEVTITITKN